MKRRLTGIFAAALLTACLDTPDVALANNGGDTNNSGNDEENPPATATVNLDCSNMGTIVNNRFDVDAKKNILCLHNKFRSDTALGKVPGYAGNLPMASNMQALRWDHTLEQVAQNYANQCVWQHNGQRTTDFQNLSGNPALTYVGENIAYYSYTANPMAMIRVKSMFDGMATGEAKNWSFGTINGTESCSEGQCGHATQMFWADTQYIGCAITHCNPSMNPHPDYPSLTDIYLVCNYGQGGNIENQNAYSEALQAEDICSDDRLGTQTECTEGLTHGTDYDDGL